jgi:hypothetical protein
MSENKKNQTSQQSRDNGKAAVQSIGVTTPDGKPFDIPKDGSLGLLALGYRGLMAWREARKQQS